MHASTPARHALVCLVLVLTAVVGCAGAGKTACQVIDVSTKVAEEACTVLRYLGADGQVHEERISAAELRAFGQAMAAEHAPLPRKP